ncbi:DNA replication protein psf2 [Dinochytrium kinnereticum]|nr:DNA replication protein psf2 [Dinochytrium kinnereticum]
MAIPKELWDNFTPAEIEFITEDELITITPLRRVPALDLLTVGIFSLSFAHRPSVDTSILVVDLLAAGILWPLYPTKNGDGASMARSVSQTQRKLQYSTARVEYLTSRIEEERSRPAFSALPFHYMAIANLLVTHASEDIPRLSDVVESLKTLRDIRQNKAMAGLKLVNADLFQQGSHVVMDGLSLMEINEIRPVFVEAFGRVRSLLPDAGGGKQQPAA